MTSANNRLIAVRRRLAAAAVALSLSACGSSPSEAASDTSTGAATETAASDSQTSEPDDALEDSSPAEEGSDDGDVEAEAAGEVELRDPRLNVAAYSGSLIAGGEPVSISLGHDSDAQPKFESKSTDVCSVESGGTVAPLKRGTCLIDIYLPVTETFEEASETWAVPVAEPPPDLKDNRVRFDDLPARVVVGEEGVTPSANSTSGLRLNYSTDGPCTIEQGRLKFDEAGICIVIASTNGNDEWKPASSRKQIEIGRISQQVTFTVTPEELREGETKPLAATATSGAEVKYEVTGEACSVSGGRVTGVSIGTCTITASAAQSPTHEAASEDHDIEVLERLRGTNLVTLVGFPEESAFVNEVYTVSTTQTGPEPKLEVSGSCTLTGDELKMAAAPGQCTVSVESPQTNEWNAVDDERLIQVTKRSLEVETRVNGEWEPVAQGTTIESPGSSWERFIEVRSVLGTTWTLVSHTCDSASGSVVGVFGHDRCEAQIRVPGDDEHDEVSFTIAFSLVPEIIDLTHGGGLATTGCIEHAAVGNNTSLGTLLVRYDAESWFDLSIAEGASSLVVVDTPNGLEPGSGDVSVGVSASGNWSSIDPEVGATIQFTLRGQESSGYSVTNRSTVSISWTVAQSCAQGTSILG